MILHPPQPNPIDETSRLDSVHVVEQLHPNGTRVELVGSNPKGHQRYPRDRDVGGHVEGGGGGDR